MTIHADAIDDISDLSSMNNDRTYDTPRKSEAFRTLRDFFCIGAAVGMIGACGVIRSQALQEECRKAFHDARGGKGSPITQDMRLDHVVSVQSDLMATRGSCEIAVVTGAGKVIPASLNFRR